jgi:hypothetical protein
MASLSTMSSRKVFRARMLAVAAAVLLALAGCGDDDSKTPTATGSSAPSNGDTRQVWLDVAKCMREHGYPNFPDPVQNEHGVWYVSTDIGGESPPECDQLVRKAKQATRAVNGPSAEEMTKLRTFAKCIREHGVPNFPDPDEDGNFDLPDGMDDAALRDAQTACKQYAPPQRPK